MINGPFGADGHGPDRATWDCKSCRAPFPCDPAREDLVGSLHPVQLAIRAWVMLETAVFDLGPATPPSGELFDRFIHWTRTSPTHLHAPAAVSGLPDGDHE